MALQPDNKLSRTKIEEETNETGPDTFATDVLENGNGDVRYGDDIKYVSGPTLKDKNPPKHELANIAGPTMMIQERQLWDVKMSAILYLSSLFRVSFHSVSTQHWH